MSGLASFHPSSRAFSESASGVGVAVPEGERHGSGGLLRDGRTVVVTASGTRGRHQAEQREDRLSACMSSRTPPLGGIGNESRQHHRSAEVTWMVGVEASRAGERQGQPVYLDQFGHRIQRRHARVALWPGRRPRSRVGCGDHPDKRAGAGNADRAVSVFHGGICLGVRLCGLAELQRGFLGDADAPAVSQEHEVLGGERRRYRSVRSTRARPGRSRGRGRHQMRTERASVVVAKRVCTTERSSANSSGYRLGGERHHRGCRHPGDHGVRPR